MSNPSSGAEGLLRESASSHSQPAREAANERGEAQEGPQRFLDTHPVVLFDGVCNLCAASVQFIIKRDPGGVFRFASLQSQVGSDLIARCRFQEPDLDSLILIESDRCSERSTGALRIARRLRFPWPLLYAFIIVPRPVRDSVYRIIARNRYRWFGRREQCWLPSEDLRRRFLEIDD